MDLDIKVSLDEGQMTMLLKILSETQNKLSNLKGRVKALENKNKAFKLEVEP